MVSPMVQSPLLPIALILSLVLPLSACADWPDLSAAPGVAGAPAPRIGPVPPFLDTVDADAAALEAETEALRRRASGLRARAARIATQD
jgi:hypothetical protein